MEEAQFDAAWLTERAEYLRGVSEDIRSLKEKKVFNNRNIAVVGAWNNIGEIEKILKSLDLKLMHIADNNPNKQGISRLGIISESVEELNKDLKVIILVINNQFWLEISTQLEHLGYKKNVDYYVIFGGEKFRRLSGNKSYCLIEAKKWEQCKVDMKCAYEHYIEINKKYGGKPIWLMHQPSLGDLYIFAAYLPYFYYKSNIADCDCVLVVTKNSTKKLAEIIGFKNIEIITFDEANKQWLLLMRLMGDELNLYNAVYHGQNNVFQTIVHYSDVSFADSFIHYVFQLEGKINPIYPQFPSRKEYVLNLFKEYGLTPGKTVLLSPYAGHFEACISNEQWEYLVKILVERGYTVCTNCGSKEEKPIKGSKAPFIELQDCVEFVETAGYFIGVRSGFCDLICMANCKKIVLYETAAPAGSIKFFGFESMGIGKNIIEVVNDCIHTDEMMNSILEKLEKWE